jgi:hypothetical protein
VTDHLDDVFADYRAGLTPEITPAGPGAVRATVRRRRRITTTAVVATAAVLVAAPVAGYAAINRGAGPDPAPAGSSTPTPEQSTATPTPPPSASASPPPPSGRISRSELLATAVDLPPWQSNAPSSCTRENVRLASESASLKPWLMDLVYGDANADGAQETIATLGCSPGNFDMQQVVVFDRDASGRVVTLAQVVRTNRDGIGWIIDVTAGGKGKVKARVGDIRPCCDVGEEQVQKQDRTYSWNGKGFAQTGGPTTFGERPDFRIDLRVTTSDLAFTPGTDGRSPGEISVTIRNNGPRESFNLAVSLDLAGLEVGREGSGWNACSTAQPAANEKSSNTNCALKRRLNAGESITLRFQVWADSVPEGLTGTAEVSHYEESFLPDLKASDNRATFEIR